MFEHRSKPDAQKLFDTPTMKRFLVNRNIATEDFPLIERLVTFPKDMIIANLHNMFNMNKERSGHELELSIKTTSDDTHRELYETFLAFYNKYDWAVCFNLVRVLEAEIV